MLKRSIVVLVVGLGIVFIPYFVAQALDFILPLLDFPIYVVWAFGALELCSIAIIFVIIGLVIPDAVSEIYQYIKYGK